MGRRYDKLNDYQMVIAGLYWHFVDLVWIFISHSFICGRSEIWKNKNILNTLVFILVMHRNRASFQLIYKRLVLLFVLSISYAVDAAEIQGYLRWFLVTVFAFKGGPCVGVFIYGMERMAFLYAIMLRHFFYWL